MWNDRCTIIKVENSVTGKQRQRDTAYELCRSYQFKLDIFHPKHHHLFRKREHFFKTSTMDTIYMWQNEVYSAMKHEHPTTTKKITTFFQSQHHQQLPTPPEHQHTQTKKHKQKPKRPTFLLPKKRSTFYYPNTIAHRTKKQRTQPTQQNNSKPHYTSDSSTHIKIARQTTIANAFRFHSTSESPLPTAIMIPSTSTQYATVSTDISMHPIPNISAKTQHRHRHAWSTEILRSPSHASQKQQTKTRNPSTKTTSEATKTYDEKTTKIVWGIQRNVNLPKQLQQNQHNHTLLTTAPELSQATTTSSRFKRSQPGSPTNLLDQHPNNPPCRSYHTKRSRTSMSHFTFTLARPYF